MSASCNHPMIVAHRGASRDAPENTIPAFQMAWQQGADAIEGDFHLTKDGEIVCIHDSDTRRVTGTHLTVRESTLSQLRTLDAGASYDDSFKGTLIPTLAEVFDTVPQEKGIFVEIKCGAEIVPSLLTEIDRSNIAMDQVLVISFNKEMIKALKRTCPQCKASWLCSFSKEGGVTTPPLEVVLNTLKQIDADGLSSNTATPTSFVKHIADHGYNWHVWTVDDPETAQRMYNVGAKSITTNTPAIIRHCLAGGSRI